MKLEHTQGPWQVLPEEEGVPYIRIRGTVLGARYMVANVHMQTYADVDAAWNEKEKRESRANARLIAAAPEMLEALQACADWLDWLHSPIDDPKGAHAAHIKAAREALAKATGGPT